MRPGDTIWGLPSPCGVLVLKFEIPIKGTERLYDRFRPLAGFWFLNHYIKKEDTNHEKAFPSPCGVLVLKSMQSVVLMQLAWLRFRPLAGFWFLNAIVLQCP